MPDPNTRLKAIIHDAKLACRFKLSQMDSRFGAGHETLKDIRENVKSTFRPFDRPETWAEPIQYDELKLLRQIILLNEAPEDDLSAFSESMDAFLEAFHILEIPRTRNLFGEGGTSALNLLMLNQIRLTRQVIEPKIAAFKAAGMEPDEEQEIDEANERYQGLFEVYHQALVDNEVSTKKTDLNLFKIYHEAFVKVDAAVEFTPLLQEYNDTIESRCPKPEA